MKIRKIIIDNFKAIEHAEINLNEVNFVGLFGNPEQGKTTILDAIRATGGGEKYIPADAIRHSAIESKISIEYSDDTASMLRIFKGTEKSEIVQKSELKFYRKNKDGKYEVSKPAGGKKSYIGKLFNKIQLDQHFFMQKSKLEQTRFLIEFLKIDVTKFQAEIKMLKSENSTLQIQADSISNEPLTIVEKPNIESLKLERAQLFTAFNDKKNALREKLQREKESIDLQNFEIAAKNKELQQNWNKENEILRAEINNFNNEQIKKTDAILKLSSEFNQIQLFSFSDCFDYSKASDKISSLPLAENEKTFELTKEPKYLTFLAIPENTELIEMSFDSAEIDTKIQSEILKGFEYSQYLEKCKKQDEKLQKLQLISANKSKIKEIEKAMFSELKKVSFEGLNFVEIENEIHYEWQGTVNPSDSQQMELSQMICKNYGSLIDLLLIDKAECLGIKKINQFVEKCEQSGTQAIVTLVSEEKNAKLAGVWLQVENGNLKN